MARHYYYVSFLDPNIALDKKKTLKDTVEMGLSHYCKSGYANEKFIGKEKFIGNIHFTCFYGYYTLEGWMPHLWG